MHRHIFIFITILMFDGAATMLSAAPRPALPSATDPVVLAQFGPGGAINPQRDCQIIKTCRFTEGGSFRGCVSTYSCRVCRFVDSSCTITGRERLCRELRCSWGS